MREMKDHDPASHGENRLEQLHPTERLPHAAVSAIWLLGIEAVPENLRRIWSKPLSFKNISSNYMSYPTLRSIGILSM